MTAEATYFDVQLKPYRALKPHHIRTLLIGLAILFALASLRMLMIGAWPVAAFLVADIAALSLAFHINFRRARIREDICLSETQLTVTRTHPNGTQESWSFEPYWVKIQLEKQQRRKPTCFISLHSQQVGVGSFLNERAVLKLHADLTSALTRWKQT